MTILDQVKAYIRTIVQSVVDKEPLNYMEAAALYGIILQGRHNISMLSSLYNQALEPELKALIKEAIDDQALPTIEKCEEFMKAGNVEIPDTVFTSQCLFENIDYPKELRLTDMEIAVAVGNIARTSQLTMFQSLLQCYQLEVAMGINQLLSSGLQWNFKLLQLMLHRGWLPKISKVNTELN